MRCWYDIDHRRRGPGEAGLCAEQDEHWPDLDEESLLAANPDVILICREVGCGVVPVEAGERERREKVGRLCCRLAARAARVERIFCGMPMLLKGEGAWS